MGEARSAIDGHTRRIVLLDSAALVEDGDKGQIIVTGSHGALAGRDPRMALRVDGFAAVFNDAGFGADNAGVGRLEALDAREIAASTVAAATARIGEAASSFHHGVISAADNTALKLGAKIDARASDLLRAWADRPEQQGGFR